MNLFTLTSIIITVVALVAFINERFIKLPTTVGVIAISLIASLFVPIIATVVPSFHFAAIEVIKNINFTEVVFHGFLGFLLFASAMHINLKDLKTAALPITLLATVSVVISTAVVGFVLSMVGQHLFGLTMPTIWYYVFGALISPTDPVAVVSIMKTLNAPKEIEMKVAGESLFNDGTGVVVYAVLLAMAVAPENVSVGFATSALFHEAGGGLLYGLALGYIGNFIISKVDSYEVETMITIAMASAGYALAEYIHVSAPLAIVVAGLVVGNFCSGTTMSKITEEKLFGFWHMLEELLNLMLFTLIGLYVLTLTITPMYVVISLAAIAVVLVARFVSVALPITFVGSVRTVYPGTIKVLTWGGLKGGVSVALALSLPNIADKDLIIMMTYAVVLFSMLVQGLTVGKLIKRIG